MTGFKESVSESRDELRIAILFTTTNIPGAQSQRGDRVANDFASRKLSRSFSYETDFVHLPADFDSDIRKAVWILCDFNVGERRSASDIPIQFWKVNYDEMQSPSVVQPPYLELFLTHLAELSKNVMSRWEETLLESMHGADMMENGNIDCNKGRHRVKTSS